MASRNRVTDPRSRSPRARPRRARTIPGASARARPIRAEQPAPGDGGGKPPAGLADVFEVPVRAFETMSQMVTSTAALLEAQIGIGITLAKFAEYAMVDVAELRSAAPGALLPRARADAHEFLDMVVDVVTMATHSLGRDGLGIVGITARAPMPPEWAAATPRAVVQMPGPPAPGQATERPVVLTNETDTPTAAMSFSSTDLLGPEGARIPGGLVAFDPPVLAVPPRSSGRVMVRVTIPEGLPSGGYEGQVHGMPVDGRETLLRVEVASGGHGRKDARGR